MHKNKVLNKHTAKLACATCHTPTIARSLPTKIWWDWSKAGQDRPAENDAFGMKTYDKMKGEFRWNKDFAPTLMWYNGKTDRVISGEKIDAKAPVWLVKLLGEQKEKAAKLTPFKLMTGKQPYDSGNNVMVYIKLFSPDGYWKSYDWNASIEKGMKDGNLPYSGKYDFVETKMVWKVSHMVAPKEQDLACNDCHGEQGRVDWKTLGYKGDPKKK